MFAGYDDSDEEEKEEEGELASTSTGGAGISSYSSFPVRVSSPQRSTLVENDRRLSKSRGNKIITLSDDEGEGSDYGVQWVKTVKKKEKKREKKHKRKKDEKATKVQVVEQERWSFLDDRHCDPRSRFSLHPSSTLHVLDRRHDAANFQFDKVYEGYTAKYTIHLRHVLGGNARIDEAIFGKPQTTKARYFDRAIVRRFSTTIPTRTTRAMEKSGKLRDFEEFVPLLKKTMKDEESGETLIFNEAVGMYVSVAEHAKQQETPTFDEMDATTRSQAMNAHLQESPQDAELWLRFIDAQDDVFLSANGLGEKSAQRVERLNDKQLLERKLAIVDKAIRFNPRHVPLRIKRLEIGQLLWEPPRVLDEWKQLEFKFVNSLEMWDGRMLANANKVNTFNLDAQLHLMDHCVKQLSSLLSGRLLSHAPQPHTASYIASVLVRRCRLLLAAGYPERAVASAQAALEFLFPPTSVVEMPFAERKQMFEEFWQANVPLIGHPSAKGLLFPFARHSPGWCDYTVGDALESLDDLDLTERECRDAEDALCSRAIADNWEKSVLWSRLETLREQRLWLPVRDLHLELEDDDRRVLFDDIAMCLVDLPDEAVRRRLFIDLIVLFGGRIFNEAEVHTLDVLRQFGVVLPLRRDLFLGRALFVDSLLARAAAVFPAHSMLFTCSRLHTCSWYLLTRDGLSLKDKQKELRDLAKKLFAMPANRDSLSLCATYAEELIAIGSEKEAITVARQAMSRVRDDLWTTSDMQLSGALRILILLAEHCDDVVDLLAAFAITGMVSNAAAITVTDRIKARNAWAQRIASTSQEITWQGSCRDLARVCFARLSYALASRAGDRLRDALRVLDVPQESSECMTRARIAITMKHVALYRETQPRFVRQILREAVIAFPDAIDFLKQYIDLCSHSIDLQRFFTTSLETPASSSLVRCVGAVYMEYRRYVNLVNRDSLSTLPEIHRIRGQLERAAQANARNQHADVFWYICMHLECMRNEPKMVKQVFYRAVQECSWSRALYIACAETCPDELVIVTDLAIEKGLRVRFPIDVIDLLLETAKGEGNSGGKQEEGMGNENEEMNLE